MCFMGGSMRFIYNPCTDASFNLAAEEWLLRNSETDIFMLWRNAASVIVGRNQNSHSEINADYVQQHGIPVVRRLTGGGAVFHDLGNINFTFISLNNHSGLLDFKRFATPITEALNALGVPCEFNGRNDMVVGESKVSGNAQHMHRDRALHHGTLLVASDLDRLGRFLTPAGVVLRTRAIASQRAAVMNLNELRPDLTVERVGESLAESWAANGGRADEGEPWAGDPRYESLCRRHASAAWRLGRTPRFEADHEVEHASGRLAVTVVVEEAVIAEVRWRRPPPPAVENAGRAAWKGLAYERFIESLRGQNVLG